MISEPFTCLVGHPIKFSVGGTWFHFTCQNKTISQLLLLAVLAVFCIESQNELNLKKFVIVFVFVGQDCLYA